MILRFMRSLRTRMNTLRILKKINLRSLSTLRIQARGQEKAQRVDLDRLMWSQNQLGHHQNTSPLFIWALWLADCLLIPIWESSFKIRGWMITTDTRYWEVCASDSKWSRTNWLKGIRMNNQFLEKLTVLSSRRIISKLICVMLTGFLT